MLERYRETVRCNGLRRSSIAAAVAVSGCLYAGNGSAQVVTSLGNEDVNDGACSLREAIISSNTHASYHGCVPAGGYIDAPPGTIALTPSGGVLPAVTAPVTIKGSGYADTIVDGQGSSGAWVLNGSNIDITDLTLRRFPSGAVINKVGSKAFLHFVKIVDSGGGSTQGGCVYTDGSIDIIHSQLEGCEGHTGGAVQVHNGGFAYIAFSSIIKSRAEHGIVTVFPARPR